VKADLVRPDWPAPPGVHALFSTRALGDLRSAEARARLRGLLPSDPVFARQVHGNGVVDADVHLEGCPEGDALVTRRRNRPCAILVADCLPVLLASESGDAIGIAHAGWRGLAAGVLEATLDAMRAPPARVLAWLGPAIGPRAYEVGDDVRAAFLAGSASAASAFAPARPGRWMLDLFAVARQRLGAKGVRRVFGGDVCTHSDASRFFSYRRDRAVERMAAAIWLS
jgi:YfiH family protein